MKQLAVLALLLLTACAARQAPPATPCGRMFVLLPDNYIIDLAAGARVYVDPAIQAIAVFCSPKDALAMLSSVNPQGTWAVYELEGDFAELAEPTGNGDFRLIRPARILDWTTKPGEDGTPGVSRSTG